MAARYLRQLLLLHGHVGNNLQGTDFHSECFTPLHVFYLLLILLYCSMFVRDVKKERNEGLYFLGEEVRRTGGT